MRNLNNYIKQTGKGLAGFIAIDSYRRTVLNDNKTTQTDKMVEDTMNKYEETTKLLEEKQDIIDMNNVKTTAIVGRLEEKLIILNKYLNNINMRNDTLTKQDVECVNQSMKSVMDEVKELLITNPFEVKKDFTRSFWDLSKFDHYGALEWGALSHIITSSIVLSCLWYILVAYYGDQIIIYFDLERKYPKLSKWIKYRKKFQQYYIWINAIFITILLISVSYVDILVLIKKG